MHVNIQGFLRHSSSSGLLPVGVASEHAAHHRSHRQGRDQNSKSRQRSPYNTTLTIIRSFLKMRNNYVD